MNFILLSGGSGKRLWPLSNDVRSKQFLKILKNEQGEYESMVQRVYRQICAAVPEARVTVATGKKPVSYTHLNLLGPAAGSCIFLYVLFAQDSFFGKAKRVLLCVGRYRSKNHGPDFSVDNPLESTFSSWISACGFLWKFVGKSFNLYMGKA